MSTNNELKKYTLSKAKFKSKFKKYMTKNVSSFNESQDSCPLIG